MEKVLSFVKKEIKTFKFNERNKLYMENWEEENLHVGVLR
jgi:hypothetical protein